MAEKEKKEKGKPDVNDLAAKLRSLEDKVERHSANWRKFASIFAGAAAPGGKVLGLVLALGLLISSAFGANLVNYPTPSGGTGFSVDDSGNATIGGTLGVTGDITFTGDLDIDGGDITCPADLTITPTGTEVFINGGLSVGDTTAVGDNNLKVVGTSLLVGAVTLTADIDIDGGDITCPADLLITPTGTEVHINGGLAVGDTTAVGDNNLKVVGTSLLVGAVTLTADIDIDGGDITCPADLLITPTGTEVHINGGLHVGGTDAVGDNNLKVDGTAEVTGVATLTAMPVCNAGLDVNEDIDIDLNASDEEISVTVTGTASRVMTILGNDENPSASTLLTLDLTADGDTDAEYFECRDNSAGDSKFKIDVDGAVTLAGTIVQSDTTASTTKDTGAIITEGGIGIEKGLFVGASTASSSKDTGAIICEGGIGTEEDVYAGGQIVSVGEVTADGKYAVVGGDATTGLMMQKADVTAGTNATETITFAVVFGAAPTVVLTYTEDPGDVRPAFVTTVTASNFLANITADKNYGYVAVGTRP